MKLQNDSERTFNYRWANHTFQLIICLKAQIKKDEKLERTKKLDLIKFIQKNKIGFHSFVRIAAIIHLNSVILVVPLLCLPLRTTVVIVYIV